MSGIIGGGDGGNGVTKHTQLTDKEVAGVIDHANTSITMVKLIQDVQDLINGALQKSGGAMTGALTLSGAPTLDLHAATKKYIDDLKLKPVLTFAVTGTLTTGNDKAPTLLAPYSLTIVKVKVVVKTAPTGSSIIIDVNKNGTTIFTTQANRPEIAIGQTTDDSGTPDVTALAETDKVTIDIDQVGSTEAGADLTCEIVCEAMV